MRRTLILLSVAGLFAAGACGKKDTPTAAGAATGGKPAADNLVLGPTGFGKVQLGMTPDQIKALGLTVAKIGPSQFCEDGEKLENGALEAYNSFVDGVTLINVKTDKLAIHTPEGIKLGSTLAEMRKAYPQVKNNRGDEFGEAGLNIVTVPGNPKADYFFSIANGKIIEMDLALKTQSCV